MKRLFPLLMLLLWPAWASAQIVTPGGGNYSGAIAGGSCTNPAFMQGISGTGVPVCATPAGGGGSGLPPGGPPQVAGYSAVNTGEAQTVGGDLTLVRSGANALTATVTKINGVTPGPMTTLNIGTGLISSGGNLNLIVPVAIGNGGTGAVTAPAAGQLLIAASTTAYAPVTMNGDASIAANGAITVLRVNGVSGPFAPLANPTGGQNNYAPLAGPSFTGGITVAGTSSLAATQVTNLTVSGIAGLQGVTVGGVMNFGAAGQLAFNGTPMGGTCSASTWVSSISATGVPTCSVITAGLFAPLTNPAGGVNNYAPLAGPTFSGVTTAANLTVTGTATLGNTTIGTASTLTLPDGSTITSAGYNTVKEMGIGMPVAAPTAGQTNPFQIASAGSTTSSATSFTTNGGVSNQANAWSVKNPPLTSGTALYAAYYASYCDPIATTNCTGPNDSYIVMQNNGPGSTVSTPLSALLQTNAKAGLQINNLANSTLSMSSTGPITFTVNGNEVASMNADATFTAYNNAQGAINFGTGGSLASTAASNFNISGGSHVVSGQWTTYPGATSATIIAGGAQPGNINFYANTGLTANATYTPTQVASLTAAFNEATWTPQLQFGGATTGIAQSASGTCWSWSKFAYCNFALVLTSKGTATGNARICGVPVAASGNGWMGGTVNYFYNFTGFLGTPQLGYGGDGNCIDIAQGNPNGYVSATDANFTAGSNFQASIYFLTL
jgi:hypothetical protein